MRGTGLSANQIGIVTPYAKQKQKLRKLLAGKGLEGVTVGTTEVGPGRKWVQNVRRVALTQETRVGKCVVFDVLRDLWQALPRGVPRERAAGHHYYHDAQRPEYGGAWPFVPLLIVHSVLSDMLVYPCILAASSSLAWPLVPWPFAHSVPV